jgi:hypothetical protein
VVDIMGGRLVSGGTFGLLSLQGLETAPGPALSALDSDVFISGGELRSGRSQELLVRAPNVVEARGSRVQINGGRFAGFVVLGASDTIITDGDLPLLAVGAVAGRFDPAPPRTEPGCTEIHGGSLSSLSILTPSETVFLFGTGFNLPLGPVPIAQVSTPGFIGSSPPTPSAVVTGTLASGTPLDLDVFAAVLSARVVLAAPGSPGCLLVGAR